jgi:uncharacterized membrane protein HdeD (DUF308 family)
MTFQWKLLIVAILTVIVALVVLRIPTKPRQPSEGRNFVSAWLAIVTCALGVVGIVTVLDIETREPGSRHSLSLQQIERWLAGATTNPNEASKKAKLKMLLVKR